MDFSYPFQGWANILELGVGSVVTKFTLFSSGIFTLLQLPMNQIMDLKITSKSLQRHARKCEKEEKVEKLKVKKAI